jgi:peroxiredoxin
MYVRTPAGLTGLFACLWLSMSTGQAQAPDFGTGPSYDIAVPAFSDAEIGRLLSALDAKLALNRAKASWSREAQSTLADFGRRLQTERLSPAQERRVLAHLSAVAKTHPDTAGLVEATRRTVRGFTLGKKAPDIVAADLDGSTFKLSEYRGKVVVLAFSADWCGICRAEYPYYRLLLELYRDWPLAVLGVDGSTDVTAAKQIKSDQRLPYRSWWDGGGATTKDGPIAKAWNVRGWPTTYVLDHEGIIRFVDVRRESLLGAVRQLLNEEHAASLKAKTKK